MKCLAAISLWTDRFEKINYVSGHDREKNQSHSRNFVSIDHGDLINSKYQSESHSSVIPVDGCCNSEAAQLLSERKSDDLLCSKHYS